MQNTVNSTIEVQKALQTIHSKQTLFENITRKIEKNEGEAVSPGDYLVALQTAADCSQALDELHRSFTSEMRMRDEHKRVLQEQLAQKIEASKSKAIARINSVIGSLSSLADYAKLVDQDVTSVTRRTAESILSGAAHAPPGAIEFSVALSKGQRMATEFNATTLESYKTFAKFGAGGAAVLAWLTGVSLVFCLLIGALVAAGCFIVYFSKRAEASSSIAQLNPAAESEFAKIKLNFQTENTRATQEHANGVLHEDSRFQSVKGEFEAAAKNVEAALEGTLSKFKALVDRWKSEHSIILDRTARVLPSGVTERASGVSGTRFVQLGSGGCNPEFVAVANRQQRSSAGGGVAAASAAANAINGEAEPEEGKVYAGKVVKLVDFGAFVNFFGKRDGLVHVSQIANKRLNHPNELLKEGQEVKVKLLGFDDRGKARLGMKMVDQETGEDTLQTTFDVILTDAGPNKINVIKEIRSITGLGLQEASDLVALGGKVEEGAIKADAETIKRKLENAGAKIVLR